MAGGLSDGNRSYSISKFFVSGVAATALVLGATFAANININTGGGVEFGQGLTATTACTGNSSVTITPRASFANEAGAGTHKFSAIEMTGIPTNCQGAVFVFSAYDNSQSNALPLFETSVATAKVFMKSDNTFVPAGSSTGLTVTTLSSSSFKISFDTPASNSSLIYKITLESKNGTCEESINCTIGATGPGGGIIFLTPASAGNSTGKYFEVAPADVAGTYSMCSVGVVNGLALGNGIGSGQNNSAILNGNADCNGSANSVYPAINYRGNSLSDWYLASQQEMKAVKDNVLNYYSNWANLYTTSSQNSGNSTWFVDFGSYVSCGGGYWPLCTTYKGQGGYAVRPVRSFTGVN